MEAGQECPVDPVMHKSRAAEHEAQALEKLEQREKEGKYSNA